MQIPDPKESTKGKELVVGKSIADPNKTSTSNKATIHQDPVIEVVVLDNNTEHAYGEDLDPVETPQGANEEESPQDQEEPTETIRDRSNPEAEPANSKDLDYEPTNLDSDPGGFTDEDASEASSSHASPIQLSRGRKSKKKHREEKNRRDINKGTQKTINLMINTRSKQGLAPKGATTPKKV